MPSLYVVELHVTVINIKILDVAKERFLGEFMSPTKVKRSQMYLQSARNIFFIVTRFGVSRRIFMKIPYIKFHGYPSSGTELIYMEVLIDVTKIRGAFRECANAPKTYAIKQDSTIFPNIREPLRNSRCPRR